MKMYTVVTLKLTCFKTFMYQLRAKKMGCSNHLNNSWAHGCWMRLARCLSPLNFKLSLVGRGYSSMGDHLGLILRKELGTHVSRVVV